MSGGGMMIVETNDLLTPAIAARCAGVSTSTIRRWMKAGHLDRIEISGSHCYVRGIQLRAILQARATRRRTRRVKP